MNKFYEKIKNSQLVAPTAVLAIICVIVTLALSSANLLTAKRIEALALQKQSEAMSKLIKADEFSTQTAKLENGDVEYFVAIKESETIGLLFVTEANGYGGAVSIMTAIDMNGSIIAIEILDASGETPGLGQNVTKESFYSQFKGESGKVEAVTGATISSTAVTKAVNQALEYADEIINKEDKS